MTEKNKCFTLRFDPVTHKRLKLHAVEFNTSMRTVVESVVSLYLDACAKEKYDKKNNQTLGNL